MFVWFFLFSRIRAWHAPHKIQIFMCLLYTHTHTHTNIAYCDDQRNVIEESIEEQADREVKWKYWGGSSVSYEKRKKSYYLLSSFSEYQYQPKIEVYMYFLLTALLLAVYIFIWSFFEILFFCSLLASFFFFVFPTSQKMRFFKLAHVSSKLKASLVSNFKTRNEKSAYACASHFSIISTQHHPKNSDLSLNMIDSEKFVHWPCRNDIKSIENGIVYIKRDENINVCWHAGECPFLSLVCYACVVIILVAFSSLTDIQNAILVTSQNDETLQQAFC